VHAAVLATDAHKCSWLKCGEVGKQFRNQRPQVFDSIRSRNEDRHRKRQGTEVLLILEILIRCDENVELA
jgi:hypothetical protein